MLMPRLETSRGIFWSGPRNFEPRSDDEDDTLARTPLSKLPHLTSGRTLGPITYELRCNRPKARRIFSSIEFRTGTIRLRGRMALPLGHRCRMAFYALYPFFVFLGFLKNDMEH
ncbi:hypothetical protein AVEN_198538-1 [Araneus ventricosus]|uniref:Uncharacterized protein n=1 Tax=Araneus ventricosus TaxID=182803 RepID=A0A4Y2HWL1_ARAVE|nr:hypothetical protein AVEN_198538-1 [Araneus ventricosus]